MLSHIWLRIAEKTCSFTEVKAREVNHRWEWQKLPPRKKLSVTPNRVNKRVFKLTAEMKQRQINEQNIWSLTSKKEKHLGNQRMTLESSRTD